MGTLLVIAAVGMIVFFLINSSNSAGRGQSAGVNTATNGSLPAPQRAREPSQEQLRMYLAASRKFMPIFMKLAAEGRVPSSVGEDLDLRKPDQCREILAATERTIRELQLNQSPPTSALAINQRSQLIGARINGSVSEENGPIIEAALQIISVLNVHEMFTFEYANLYPGYEPLREMIDANFEVLQIALGPMIEGGMLDTIRTAYPSFADYIDGAAGGGDAR